MSENDKQRRLEHINTSMTKVTTGKPVLCAMCGQMPPLVFVDIHGNPYCPDCFNKATKAKQN